MATWLFHRITGSRVNENFHDARQPGQPPLLIAISTPFPVSGLVCP